MSGHEPNEGRRRFLGQMTLTVGGLAAASLAQASLLEASAAGLRCTAAFDDPCGDWTVDDICGAYPPYSFHTGAAMPHSRPMDAGRGGADWHWIA